MHRFGILLLIFSVGGCATAPPPWHGGFLDSIADYYDQGTGGGKSIDRSDRNAQIALVGYQQGIDVESITEDEVQSFSKQGDELIVEVSGTLPPGSYIAERWKDESGYWWSYAVSEKLGKERRIQDLRNTRLGMARMRAPVPGWAQFTKGQRQKGWRILTAQGIGLVGSATFFILQTDYKNRRDDSINPTDYEYYDDWANRFYWSHAAFTAVAGATYLYSLVDGITTVPPTYRLLLSRLDWGLEAQQDRLALVFRYDLR